MMIKCTKCGFENQMGAIFCRGCGEKIDMNTMDPDTVAKNKKKAEGSSVGKIIRKVVVWLIFLAIVGAIASAFVNYGLAPYKGAPATALRDAKAKFDRLSVEKLNTVLLKTEFSMDEVTALLKDRYFKIADEPAAEAGKKDAKAADAGKKDAKAEEGKAAPAQEDKKADVIANLKKTFVLNNMMAFAAGKNITFVIYAKAFGYIPLRFEFTGMLLPGNDTGALRFYTECGRIGYLPLPGNLYDRFILKKIAPKFASPELERILKRATAIEMNDDKLVFSFDKKEEKK